MKLNTQATPGFPSWIGRLEKRESRLPARAHHLRALALKRVEHQKVTSTEPELSYLGFRTVRFDGGFLITTDTQSLIEHFRPPFLS